MTVLAEPKRPDQLTPTSILQQTPFWSRVKSRVGWVPQAFDLVSDPPARSEGEDEGVLGDVLVIRRPAGPEAEIAYVPYGPEPLPEESSRGLWLERISERLRPFLPDSCVFIRYDLPWESPYAREEDRYDSEGFWLGGPETRLRELRMNWGTARKNLRKAPTDVLPPDTVLLDIRPDVDDLLSRMRPKTRYNIRLADRRGVRVRRGAPKDLDAWYELYLQTAERNGIARHALRHFRSIFSVPPDTSGRGARPLLLLAERQSRLLAGMILVIAGDRATYLYGASSDESRECMAPYALQLAAVSEAKAAACVDYDLFGTAPRPNPGHPMHGLYRFKTGFGGSLFHRQGCWDYPFDTERYEQYRAQEASALGFHVG